jgi:RNA polymerase sigma-70 factor (family 1)
MTNLYPMPENELLLLIAKGDCQAFATLYTSIIEEVFQYIYMYTRSRSETEEILQDVFIKVWESRSRLNEVHCIRNYLMRAAKNRLLDAVRREQIMYKALLEVKSVQCLDQHETEYTITYRDYLKMAQQAISQLPPRRKLIFRMNTESGLCYDEIADQLSITKSAVKNQLYKAIEYVRSYLEAHAGLHRFFVFPYLYLLVDLFSIIALFQKNI